MTADRKDLFAFGPEKRRHSRFWRGRMIGLVQIADGIAEVCGVWPGWTLKFIVWWDFGDLDRMRPAVESKA